MKAAPAKIEILAMSAVVPAEAGSAWKEEVGEASDPSCSGGISKFVLFAALLLGAVGQTAIHAASAHIMAMTEVDAVGETRAVALATAGEREASGLLRRGESVMRHALRGWSQGVNTSWAMQSKTCLSWQAAARARGVSRVEVDG